MPTTPLSESLNSILKETSRAFYLSLRLMPSEARTFLSLAYLLARAADTVADSPESTQGCRRSTLEAFQLQLKSPDHRFDWARELSAYHPAHPGEARLLARTPELFQLLCEVQREVRESVCRVVDILISGMVWDQDHFEQPKLDGLDAAQLEEYSYLVAGCVGPFWSEVCAFSDSRLKHLMSTANLEIAVEFGKGLQFVNILRDIPRDQQHHRHYLPALGSCKFQSEFLLAAKRCLIAFRAACRYPTLFPVVFWRERLAVFLPLVLGLRTLQKLFLDGGPRHGKRIKVARVEVFFWLSTGALFVCSNALLRGVLTRLHHSAERELKILEMKL